MAKKRYHYDAKGRLKGYSSNSLSARDLRKALLIGFAMIIGGGLLFGNGEQGDNSPSEERARVGLNALPSASTDAGENVIVQQTPTQSSGTSPEIESSETLPTVLGGTASRWDTAQEYANGDSNCPRDIVEYHEKQCALGDASSCQSIGPCAAEDP